MGRSGPSLKKRTSAAALASLTQSALIAALYLALTMATSFMSYSVIQLRLAEALTALPALFPSAIIGVFAGCLVSNLLNPAPLGLIDVVAGSLTTLVAAAATWRMGRSWRRRLAGEVMEEIPLRTGFTFRYFLQQVIPLVPPIVLNALVIGTYLPFLIQPDNLSPALVAASVGSVFVSQSVVLLGAGLPLILALKKTPWAQRVYLAEWSRESTKS